MAPPSGDVWHYGLAGQALRVTWGISAIANAHETHNEIPAPPDGSGPQNDLSATADASVEAAVPLHTDAGTL
jgi:hypothetical protein